MLAVILEEIMIMIFNNFLHIFAQYVLAVLNELNL